MIKNISKRNHKLLIRFIVSYILILLVPLSMGLHSYKTASDIVKKDIERSNLAMLNQAKDVVDNQLKQVEVLSMQISSNPRIVALTNLKEPLNDTAYYDFDATIRSIANYLINRDFINNFYIYLKDTNYVVTPYTLYKADIYFQSVLKFDKSDFNKWQEAMIGNYYTGKYISTDLHDPNNTSSPNITYIQSLPLSYLQKSKGALVLSFNKEILTKLFSSIDLEKGGWAYIQDREGNIIVNLSNNNVPLDTTYIKDLKTREDFIQSHIYDKDMVITYTTSEYNGWKYVIALPSDIVMQKLRAFERINWVIFNMSLIIGIAISIFMAYQNSKPVLNIIKQLKEFLGEDTSKSEDAFSVINGSLNKLISSNRDLQQNINNQKPLIHAAFVGKLLKGQIYTKAELEATSTYVGIELEGKKSVVLLTRIYNNDIPDTDLSSEIIQELNVSKALVREVLNKYLNKTSIVYETDHRTIAILVNSNQPDDAVFLKEIEAAISSINMELWELYNMKIFIGGGDVYADPLYIWQSLEQAERALEYTRVSSDNVVWYADIPKESDNYYYPLDFEQRLIKLAQSGDTDQTLKLLQIIYDENFHKRNLSINMSKELFYEIKSTIVKIMSHLSDEGTIKKLLKSIDLSKPIDLNFEVLEDIFTNICGLVLSEKSNQNSELMKNIKKFIETNYSDQDLGLYKVSSNFNLSEGYFSHLFKEQTGINFTDYLEKVRMDHACELLKNKDYKVDEIAEMVGYNSAQSFRRAFKRMCGVSPTALRKI